MSSASMESKQLVARYLQALSGQRKTSELIAEYVADGQLATHIRNTEAAFPQYEMIADDLIAENDRVAVRGTFHGIHAGPFAGVPATGKAVSAPFMIVYRVRDHHIVEHWLHFDGAAIATQLQQAATAGAA
jgi:predicted ester cyclase